MGDPLFTPAFVGAAVSLLLKEVIDAAKGATKIKQSCKALKVKVDKIVPLLEVVQDNPIIFKQAHLNWLLEFKTILIDAQCVLEKCLMESRASTATRLMKVWQWRKLPSRLKLINDQIDEARLNAILATLGVRMLFSNSTQKLTKPKVGFVKQPTPPLVIGVEKLFNKLKSSIVANQTNDKSTLLSLQGRGGAGKTLLAAQLNNDEDIKAIYGSEGILWITVGLDARIPDLYKTMGKFLNDGVFEDKYAHCNQEDQRTYLWNAFAKRKVFLILDDVWEKQCDHRDMMYWLNIASGPGSTTLITSRNATILSKVHAKVEVVLLLSDEDSWALFCAHAFENGLPPPNIPEDLAREVCKECKGLPLALKVIGCAMRDKHEMEWWRLALYELKQSKSILNSNVDDELYQRLQLSYNNLNHDVTKMCFLYCAAFPEDYKIRIGDLCKIWIAEGLFGVLDVENPKDVAMVHLEILVKRSMIDWNRDYGYIIVHDIMRDLAMYIIDTAKPEDCASKCWFQSGKVLTSPFATKSLEKMQRMSFVESTILEWPDQLDASDLEVCFLQAMSSREKRLCIPQNFFSNFGFLKYLDLSKNHFNEKLPEMCGLRSLLVLDLQNCSSLIELPESIGELKSLMEMNLAACSSLRELPQSIGGLKCLTKLKLARCESLIKLPECISELKSLIKLDLRGCSSLRVLPQSIGGMKCLTKVQPGGCTSLIELPKSIGELKSLIELNLWGCSSLRLLPQSIGGSKCLTKLQLGNSTSLIELPESIGELKCLIELNLWGCSSLRVLPQSIGGLKCLTKLNLGGCESLIELLESIGKLKSLIELDLGFCSSLKGLPQSIGGLKCLTKFVLEGCTSLIELPESIGELKSLIELNLWGCSSLRVLPQSIGGLKCLTKLNLGGCESLIELLESIGKLKSLIELDLGFCSSLKVLPQSIGGLKCLTKFVFEGCTLLIELPESIGELKSLIELNLWGCSPLRVLPQSIGGLKCLTKLQLGNSTSLIELPESIGKLKSLIELDLGFCSSLKVLPQSIGGLKCLTKFILKGCECLIELPESMGNFKSLIELNLWGCSSLRVLPQSIGGLKCLTKLNLGGCTSLIELFEGIGELKSLIELNLGECTSLIELPETIGELKSLIELDLQFCTSLKVLPQSIGGLKCLTKLEVRGCTSLIELPESIRESKSLIELDH